MTNFRLLGAAAILSSMLAGPAMAQQVISNPGKCQAEFPNANCLNEGPGNPYTGTPSRYRHRMTYRSDQRGWNDQRQLEQWLADSWNDNRWDRHDFGFWPGDVAAGVVGGALGTAGAIATAPFRGIPTPMTMTAIAADTIRAGPSATASSACPAPGSRAKTAAAISASSA